MTKTDEKTGLPAEWVVAALSYVLAAVPKKDNDAPAAQAASEEGADASTPEPTKKAKARARKAPSKASGKAAGKPSRKPSTRRRGTTAESIVDGGL